MYTRVPLGDVVEIQKGLPLTTKPSVLCPNPGSGAYILSPLQEASRDPVQNAGFLVRWLTPAGTTRVTSYSLRNSLDTPPPPLSPSVRDAFPSSPTTPRARKSFGSPPTSPSPLKPDVSSKKEAVPEANNSTTKPTFARALSRRSLGLGIGAPRLSNLLAGAAPAPDTKTTFAAFKALPVDPARSRRGSAFSEPADELAGAATCQDAVELMVNVIRGACEDVGGGRSIDGNTHFVKDAEIVGCVWLPLDIARSFDAVLVQICRGATHDDCVREDGIRSEALIMARRLELLAHASTCTNLHMTLMNTLHPFHV